ncbi:MAG TPA: NUDIX domain-containing protein [Candidatus Babeliales bacterium]|nr:NUDIX domain-containing protein [Candidatus Babeliales bacterium]
MNLHNIQDDELLDIVNDEDRVIGQQYRSVIYVNNLHNYRGINGFIKNSQGQLWIPRRTAHKKLFPLALDTSVGGHVMSGESYLEAFARETKEELNLDISELKHKQIGYFTPANHSVSGFMHVYEIVLDTEPHYNKADFIESYWLYPHEIIERLHNGDKAKDDLSKLIKLLYKC